MVALHGVFQIFIYAIVVQIVDAPVRAGAEIPGLRRRIFVEGAGQSARDQVRLLRRVVVDLGGIRRREQGLPVDEDLFPVLYRHMARAVFGHHRRQLRFALVRVRMVVRVGAVAPVEGIRVLRQVVHARHGRSGAAGVESGAGGKVKSALIGLVLGGQDDVLRHGIIGQHAHHVGTHRARDHAEEIDAESLRRRAGVIIGRVQLDAVGHLVGQHSGNLVHVAVQSHYKPFVHRDVIRREAGRVEFRTVVHVPAEGEGTDIQHVVAAFHQPFHHFPDNLMVHG